MTTSTTLARSVSTRNELQSIIDRYMNNKSSVSILEAGCGSVSKINFSGVCSISGIDISEKQLNRNTVIGEKICADIQVYDLSGRNFDIIICYHVIEHLKYPKAAIQNMLNGLKSGGLLILAAPNLLSIKGLVTKFTPHTFHVWFYRNIYGKKNAGRDDNAPFKTYLKSVVSPMGMVQLAKEYALSIEYLGTDDALTGWAGSKIIKKSILLFRMIMGIVAAARVMSLNIISDSEFLVVFRKN